MKQYYQRHEILKEKWRRRSYLVIRSYNDGLWHPVPCRVESKIWMHTFDNVRATISSYDITTRQQSNQD
jgi:hypothetical protein